MNKKQINIINQYDQFVIPFSEEMKVQLLANKAKGDRSGWLKATKKELLCEMFYHAAKLQEAVRSDDKEMIKELSADVANCVMMIADKCEVLNILNNNKIKTMPNLKDVVSITEADKSDMINWLGSTLDYLEDNDGSSYSSNRVFGTDNDDIDEAKNFMSRMFLTLQTCTLVPKNSKTPQKCPDCGADLEVNLSTGDLKFIKHNV
jgi:transcriptional regulator of met regulon